MAIGSKTAISKVFTNVDLMEDILLRLPIREILCVNGVCQGWQKVYNESPRIQKVLFLSPTTEHAIYYPNHEKPFWYLAPDRKELLTAGFDIGLVTTFVPSGKQCGRITPSTWSATRRASVASMTSRLTRASLTSSPRHAAAMEGRNLLKNGRGRRSNPVDNSREGRNLLKNGRGVGVPS